MRNPAKLVLINIRASLKIGISLGKIGILFGFLFGVVSVPAQGAIYGFAEFDPGLYRGSHPDSQADFEILKRAKIKTILSLQWTDPSTLPEKEQATLNQITYINIPFSYVLPSREHMVEILGHLQNDSLKPLYLHCRQGRDRTGLAVAMYRIHVQNGNADTAYDEMIRFNFNWGLQWVLHLFFEFYKTPGSLLAPVTN